MNGGHDNDFEARLVRPMSRRQFLLAAAGGAAAAAGVYGCGSGGGGNGGGGGTISDTARYATFGAIHDFITTLPEPDPDARRQAVLGFIQARPEFEAAGESGDGSLWARFTDNRLYLLIANTDDPTRDVPIPWKPTRAGPAELPRSVNARILLGVGPNEQNGNTEIKALLSQRGYNVLNTTGSIYDLKLVNGDGIFYILAHGGNGYDRANNAAFGVTSSTEATANDDRLLALDWANQRIGYADVVDTRYYFFDDPKTYYLFTENFVTEYMSFGPHSVVLMGACNSASPRTPSFNAAVRSKGAGVFMGWTHNTQRRHNIAAALYVFDRLLGANDEGPTETPDQRAFDYFALKADMTRKGLDRSDSAEFVMIPGSGGESGLLAPSIKYMDVVEHEDKLILHGKFGSIQGRVEIDGFNRTIISWTKEKIEARLPRSGQGSAGVVAVFVDNRESNHRYISDWRIRFDVSQKGDAPMIWQGPLNIHIRADIGSHRENPGDAPVYRQKVPFRAAPDTTGNFIASGRITTSTGFTEWSGSSNLVNGEFVPAAANPILCYGEFDPGSSRLRMVLVAFATQGMSIVSERGIEGPLVGSTGLLDGNYSAAEPLPCLDLVLGNNFEIPGSVRIEDRSGYELKMIWQTATPDFPPDDVYARSAKVTGR